MAHSPRIEVTPFDFDENGDVRFEILAKTNGTRYWSARDLMKVLGYEDWAAFKKVINKAVSACALLNIQVFDMFIQAEREINGRTVEDFNLSRSACCMVALNADSKKRNVAAAQMYFVALVEVLVGYAIEHAESMDRLAIREEISEREILLSKTAATAGVDKFGLFRSAGYRGMYDMPYQELRELRGVGSTNRSVLDFMGKDELAGNLFRLTLTEGRLRKEGTSSQSAAEHVAEQVGRTVRRTMIEQTGIAPEQLPTAQDIRVVRKGLKKGTSEFAQLDDIEGQRTIEAKAMKELLPAHSRGYDPVPGCAECAGANLATHDGSPNCTSGSIASGGTIAHCTCDYCY
jgi:DNA-damage-inducible protein D